MGRTRASFLSAIAFVGAVIACNAATVGLGPGGSSDAQPPCPASFAEVATATCSVEGQSCTFLSPCATFASNVTCVCTGGSFACAGFRDAGTACPTLTTSEPCPISEKAARGLFCSDLGLICTYPSVCSGIPAYDSCYCAGGVTADDQPHFECHAPCTLAGDAAAPNRDASMSDARVPNDGPADDGPAEAAPSTDGASDP